MTSLFELPSQPEGHLHLLMRSRRAVSSTAPVLLQLRGQQSGVDGTWQDMTQHRALWRGPRQRVWRAKRRLCTNRTLQREGTRRISLELLNCFSFTYLFIWKLIQNGKPREQLGGVAFNCSASSLQLHQLSSIYCYCCVILMCLYIYAANPSPNAKPSNIDTSGGWCLGIFLPKWDMTWSTSCTLPASVHIHFYIILGLNMWLNMFNYSCSKRLGLGEKEKKKKKLDNTDIYNLPHLSKAVEAVSKRVTLL